MADKRRQLDDEMSRFEAEISGPASISPFPRPPAGLKTIIGAKTFNKVQQQLDGSRPIGPSQPLAPPPAPPTLCGPNDDMPYMTNYHNEEHFNGMPRNLQAPPSFSQPPRGGPNFNEPQRPPASFVPHQLSRPPCGPMYPGNEGMPPRPPFMNPPPSAHGLTGSPNKPPGPGLIAKPPTVFSSAPQLYNKPKTVSSIVPKMDVSTFTDYAQAPRKKFKSDFATDVSVTITETPLADKMHNNANKPGASKPPPASDEKKKDKKTKKNLRYAGGQVWEDQSLAEWDPDDFRLFAGDLGNDVTDELLNRYFSHYPSFVKAKVVRDKRTNKSKGYGFISFRDSVDYIRSMKEVNGKYVGSRPIKLRKSMWRDRSLDVVQKKVKDKQLIGLK